MSKSEPYYSAVIEYPVGNKEKGRLGEEAFREALLDYPVSMNITYGKRQNDIDHLVFTGKTVVMNECKNTEESFFMWYSWFSTKVADRFADGLPVAQYYAHTFGYPVSKITFTLTIPRLNTEPIVMKALKGLKIHVIQTGRQALNENDKKYWYNPIRRQILSVINTTTSKYGYNNEIPFSCNNDNANENIKKDNTSNTKPYNEDAVTVRTDATDNKDIPPIPPGIMEKLQEYSLYTAFPLTKIMEAYYKEAKHLIKKGNQPTSVSRLALTRTFLTVKRNYQLFWKCQYCTSFDNYGCSLFRLSVKFMALLKKSRYYSEKNRGSEIERLYHTISSEFSEIHDKLANCVLKRSFLHRKLDYKTMDYTMPTSDVLQAKPIQISLDPERELREELEKLKKEKEQLLRWKFPRKRLHRFD